MMPVPQSSPASPPQVILEDDLAESLVATLAEAKRLGACARDLTPERAVRVAIARLLAEFLTPEGK